MTIGAVRWFDVPKGYGFIKPDDGGVDVLVDICAVERAGMACLDQGQRLSFEVVRDERIGRSCAENLNESFFVCSPITSFCPRATQMASRAPGRTAIREEFNQFNLRHGLV